VQDTDAEMLGAGSQVDDGRHKKLSGGVGHPECLLFGQALEVHSGGSGPRTVVTSRKRRVFEHARTRVFCSLLR
jgi:hypothetical protein